jgi:hypothetical protein
MMTNKKNLILIIVAVVIILGIGGYVAYHYFYSPKIPIISNIKPIPNPTVVNKETKSNYIPSDLSAVLNLSAYTVDTEIRQLSDGGTQYVSSFKTDNPDKVLANIKSQLLAEKYNVSSSTTSNFITLNANNSEAKIVINVFVLPPSASSQSTSTESNKSTIIISFYKNK